MRKAIFLDRDGTLNVDCGYAHRPEDWQWLPHALEALAMFRAAGWLLAVVSNQSGLGRGYFSREELKNLETFVNADLRRRGLAIDAWHYCPHRPDEHCSCRKPSPEMILSAAEELDICLERSWMLGDRLKDVEAGIAAGCHAGLVANPRYPEDIGEVRAAFPQAPIWPDLAAAARDIINGKAKRGEFSANRP